MSNKWTAGMMKPTVVRGTVITNDLNYVLGTNVIKTGDLIRLSTTGTVEPADADTAGCVHGIALANSVDKTAGKPFPVALFTPDTEIAIQMMAAKDQNDVAVGVAYNLDITANAQNLTVTTDGSSMAHVCGLASQDSWFDEQSTASYDQSVVYVKFSAACLSARIAA